MLSLILVDDEQQIRESISELLDWKKLGFNFLGAAENGLDALQLIEKKTPDVLITDIKMPVMDGIELAQRVREEYPTIKIVFLSGYDEFEFAVSGIRLNIASYLLKPISKQELESTLEELRIDLEMETREATDIQVIEKGYMENIEVMKISFLISLLTDNYNSLYKEELVPFLKRYNLEFLLKKKRMVNIHLSENRLNDKRETQQTELMRFSLSNTVKKIVATYVQAEVFIFASNVICLIGDEEEQIEERIDVLVKEIYESAKKLYNQKVTIGISETYDRIIETKHAFQGTIEAINYSKVYGKGNIVFISDIESRESQSIGLTEDQESKLLLAVKLGEENELKQLLEETLTNVFASSSRFQVNMRFVLGEIFIICMRALRESGVELEEKYADQYSFYQEMMQYEHIDNMSKRLFLFCKEVMVNIQKHRKSQIISLADKAEKYIKENYDNPDLSMKNVSQHLSISPSYFSSVFKKETGYSFTEKLTEIRMNKAREFVLSTELKMFEIATRCGFSDQHYFSYSFKKYYKQSPSKLRKEVEETRLNLD